MKILVTKVDAAKTGVRVSFTVLKKKEKRGFVYKLLQQTEGGCGCV